ncbi:MAG: glycolate oxidase subunit GlcF [Alphaproteobacteria bacterium]|nr:glycolate oxidase subunit GlcF [Alphaproteobacteria bacterium]
MQTAFTDAQRADPDISESEKAIRGCVHCGFCTATCPTYVLLGDELDSPRGRIVLMKVMLESGRPADATTVKHIDRCLSCLSCMTTCPSGVNYMHLVDHARKHIEATFRRPLAERVLRAMLASVLTQPGRLRLVLTLARRFRRTGEALAKRLPPPLGPRLSAMLDLAPKRAPQDAPLEPGIYSPTGSGKPRARVALLAGCAQQILAPEINRATVRLLNRLDCEVVVPQEAGCCGALAHHLGSEQAALASVRANIAAWEDAGQLDAVIANASGCGTMLKDYGFLLRGDAAWKERAERTADFSRDLCEFVTTLGLPQGARAPAALRVAYQSACSMQHGQKLAGKPQALLRQAGFTVLEPAEAHLCCGSAGTYNVLQPEIANQLRARKAGHLAALRADVIASGNIGCMSQLEGAVPVPMVHTAELLDWATGGPPPLKLKLE